MCLIKAQNREEAWNLCVKLNLKKIRMTLDPNEVKL